MRKVLYFAAALLIVGASVLALAPEWKSSALRAEKARPSAVRPGSAIAVEAAPARITSYRADLQAIGSLRSDESVQVASEITGRIESFAFNEGQPVKAGEKLIKLDDALARPRWRMPRRVSTWRMPTGSVRGRSPAPAT
jgi:membrane fusion protein (multidrug efflux system)